MMNNILYRWNDKQVIVLSGFILLAVGMFSSPPGIEETQFKTLCLLLFSILIWSTQALPISYASLLIIGLELLLGLAVTFEQAVQGFLSSVIYFILSVSLMNQVIIKVELDRWIAESLIRRSNGSIQKTAFIILISVMVLPIFMPSAVSRFKMFMPLIIQMNEQYGLEKGSPFVRFCLWCFGGLNQVTTMVVLTGGGFAIIASQFISENIEPFSWFKWFYWMAPPIYLSVIMTGVFMWFYWNIGSLHPEYPIEEDREEAPEKLFPSYENDPKLYITMGILLCVLILWMFGTWWNIPAIVPPIVSLAIFSLPALQLLDKEDIRQNDWDSFLFIGSALSLSAIIQENGTSEWIASLIFNYDSQTIWIRLGLFIVSILIMRMFFVAPSSAMAVILPMALIYGSTIGLPLLELMLLTTLLIGSMLVLPILSPTMYIAFQTGYFSMREQWTVGVFLVISVLSSTLFTMWFIW